MVVVADSFYSSKSRQGLGLGGLGGLGGLPSTGGPDTDINYNKTYFLFISLVKFLTFKMSTISQIFLKMIFVFRFNYDAVF